MKSASFDYIRPETLDAACACLASHPDARIIAGGQSLVPMLAMRLARPSTVIDIAHIDGLSTIQETTDTVVIGAMVNCPAGSRVNLAEPRECCQDQCLKLHR